MNRTLIACGFLILLSLGCPLPQPAATGPNHTDAGNGGAAPSLPAASDDAGPVTLPTTADAGQEESNPPISESDAGQPDPSMVADAGSASEVTNNEGDAGQDNEPPSTDAGSSSEAPGAWDAGNAQVPGCDDGFVPDAGGCSQVDDCVDINCNDGTCVDGVNDYVCACDDGFTGDHCETNIDDCVGVDCGPGSCVDLVNGFECNCANGYQDNDNNGTCELACGTTNCGPCNMCEDASGQVTCLCSGAAGCEAAGEVCVPIFCGANEFVENHTCGTCEGGTYNLAGDNAFAEENTSCDEECLVDAHCGTTGPFQVCTNNLCVGCADHGDCSGDLPYCSNNINGNTQEDDNDSPAGGEGSQGLPGGGSGPSGAENADDSGGGTSSGICVECSANAHCSSTPGHPYCIQNECQCQYDSDCAIITGPDGNPNCSNGGCR